METILTLKLERGKETLAELQLKALPGSSPLVLNYECMLDQDPQQVIVLAGIAKRADPLQVAADALHLLGYPHSGRKAQKSTDKKKGNNPPVL